MKKREDIRRSLDFINNISSIAIIGPSKKRNYYFLRTFRSTFKGKVFAIKPGLKKIEEFPDVCVYNKLEEIPGDENVDFIFIAVPRELVIDVIKDAIKKGVKLAAIFTAGFADDGSEIGLKLQVQLKDIVNQALIRVIGPNGMGLYYPRLGIRWRSSLPIKWNEKERGVGIIAQSGGLCNLFIHGLISEAMQVSKAFSIGNAIDINVIELLAYFRGDEETNLVLVYIEGIPEREGRALVRVMKNYPKPIVLIKGGRTLSGIRAIESHTASLAGNYKIWRSVMRSTGAMLVDSFLDAINVVKILNTFPNKARRRVKNVAMATLSGGYGVISTDIFAEMGFVLPNFSKDDALNPELSRLFNTKGTSFKNPLDFAILIYQPKLIEKSLDLVLARDYIDCLVFEIPSLYISHQMRDDISLSDSLHEMLVKMKKKYQKPIFVVIQHVGYDSQEVELKRRFQEANIPVFEDTMLLARALVMIRGNI
ncbi:MAG: CoA-binding protein [Promethearchaeota archaeon]